MCMCADHLSLCVCVCLTFLCLQPIGGFLPLIWPHSHVTLQPACALQLRTAKNSSSSPQLVYISSEELGGGETPRRGGGMRKRRSSGQKSTGAGWGLKYRAAASCSALQLFLHILSLSPDARMRTDGNRNTYTNTLREADRHRYACTHIDTE